MASQETPPRVELYIPDTERPEESRDQTSETAQDPEVGTKGQARRLDGLSVQEVFTGSAVLDRHYQVFARQSGGETRVRVTTPEEDLAREIAERQYDLFTTVLDSNVASATKVAGLQGEASEGAATTILNHRNEIIAKAVGQDDPEKALTNMVRTEASAIASGETGAERPSLEDLVRDLTHARQEALGAKNDKQYQSAVARIHALELAVYERRSALHPDANTQEKAQIADETEGLVVLTPDAIYSKGPVNVLDRLKELEKEMQKADKEKNETAWLRANEERTRHLGAHPSIEMQEKIRLLEEKLRAIDKAPAGKNKEEEYQKTDTARKRLIAKVNSEPVLAEVLGIASRPVERSGERPVDRLMRDIANATIIESKTVKAKPSSPNEPIVEELLMDKPRMPLSNEERKNYADLVSARILEQGDDLATWEKTFGEVLAALEILGLKPEDEGLPNSFQDVLNTKDKRGFFGKLFRGKTDRVKMIERIGELHYQYIESGQVDVSKYLENQRVRSKELRRNL